MALLDILDIAQRLVIQPDPEITGVAERVLRPITDHYFQTDIIGIENLPSGGALMVSNHGLYAYDTLFFMVKLFNLTGRMTRPMVDHNFFRIPGLRQGMALFGFVDGNQDNAVRLLKEGELALVFPGGALESLHKRRENLYQLMWQKSYGFIKVAIRSGTPLVPVAAIGPDDALFLVADHEQLRNGPVGQATEFIFGKPKYIPPLALGLLYMPLPLPVPFTYYIGKPTYLEYPPEAADDEQLVKRLKTNFQRRLERLIQKGLKERENI